MRKAWSTCERGAAGGRHAAEHPLRRGEALDIALAGVEEVAEHLHEIGAIQRQRNRLDAQADPLHAFDVDAAGDLLGEGRKSLLRRGGARRGQAHARQHLLLLAVERGQRMHEGLVLQQLVAVVIGERGTGTQADPVRAGRGLGDQVGIEFDGDDAAIEIIVQRGLQLQAQRGRRNRHLLLRRQQFAVEFVGDRDEVVGGLAGGRAARQHVFGLAEQGHRQVSDARTAEALQQFGGEGPAARRLDQVDAERMRGIGGGDDCLELASRLGEVVLRVPMRRQLRPAPGEVGEEGLLLAGRPADQAQQADRLRRLGHARVERGVMGDVGGERRVGHFSAARTCRPAACSGPCPALCRSPSARGGLRACSPRRRPRRRA